MKRFAFAILAVLLVLTAPLGANGEIQDCAIYMQGQMENYFPGIYCSGACDTEAEWQDLTQEATTLLYSACTSVPAWTIQMIWTSSGTWHAQWDFKLDKIGDIAAGG